MGATFTNINKDEMDSFLKPKGFKETILPRCNEIVYDFTMPSFPNCVIRIYSSIVGDMSRGLGGDAIRILLFNVTCNRPMSCSVKVYRSGDWKKRVSEKTVNLINEYKKAIHYSNN